MASVILTFTPPHPAPLHYIVTYWPKDDVNNKTTIQISGSPHVIENLPNGKVWAGTIQAVCGFKHYAPQQSWEIGLTIERTEISGAITYSNNMIYLDVVEPMPCEQTIPIHYQYGDGPLPQNGTVSLNITNGNTTGSVVVHDPLTCIMALVTEGEVGGEIVYDFDCGGALYRLRATVPNACGAAPQE